MKPIADDVIANTYYTHFDYFLSCVPISGKVLKLEGYFVSRKVYTTRVPGEMCEEPLYNNYKEANQGLVDKLPWF